MAQTTVEQFAGELKLPTALLLEQLKSAGVNKSLAEDQLSESDKTALLDHLRKEHGTLAPKNKITLMRKSSSEIKKTDNTGKARTIQVEIRKKRIIEQPLDSAAMEEAATEAANAAALVEEVAPAAEMDLVPQVEAALAESAPEEEPVVAAAPVKTINRKDLLGADEIALREQEAKGIQLWRPCKPMTDVKNKN